MQRNHEESPLIRQGNQRYFLGTEIPRVPIVTNRRGTGVLLCVISGVAFGTAAVIATECYRSGLGVAPLLAGRFTIAAALLWLLVAIRRPARPPIRVLGTAIALGAIGYALQAACYFAALTKLDAGMVAELLYIYPALVLLIAVARRRARLSGRTVAALACSAIGLGLLLRSGSTGSVSALGVGLAIGAAVTYALYITVASSVGPQHDVYLISAVVCSSAAVSVSAVAVVRGQLHGPRDAAGWGWLALFALVPTLVAIVAFLAGLQRVGAPVAAILSGVEPVVTTLSAALVFGERLTTIQLLGATVVVSSVVVLQLRRAPEPHGSPTVTKEPRPRTVKNSEAANTHNSPAVSQAIL
jgi:drug/metabolite transporter (DMT)-like permease